MEPGLDIVIVNYRTPGDLYECLMSIVDHPPSVPTDLHVAQVQPLDGDLRAVHIPLPLFAECGITVHPWQFDDNVGYNWAVNETVGRGSREFVAILNADVVFPGFTTARPSTFDALISRLDGHPDAAVVGPRQVDKDGLITAGGIFGTNLKPKHRAWKQPVRPGVADDVRLDSVTLAGSMMMWRRSAWNQLAHCVHLVANIARGTGLRHPGGAFAPCFHYYGETWACMAEGSWVWTTRGPVEIQDVIAGDEVFGFDGYGLARGTVSKAGCTGVQEVFEIETKGRVLRATADHRVLTVSAVAPNGSGGTQGWKRVDELIPGDCIVAAVELPSETDVDVLPDGTAVTPELVQFLGAYIGDGACDGRAVTLCIPVDADVRETYEWFASVSFVKLERRTRRGRPSSPAVTGGVKIQPVRNGFRFSSRVAAAQLAAWGVTGTAATKRIPQWVFSLSRPLRLRFLAGLIDSDGSITRSGQLSIGFANRGLIEDVRCLLASCGIPVGAPSYRAPAMVEFPTYSSLSSPAWRVTSNTPNEIPFADTRYKARLRDVPRRGGKSIGDVELNREQLALRRVRSVVPVGESRTFDLTVPGLDSFVADGVVVHNCYHARAHGMPVVYDGTVTVVHKWHQASKVGGAGEQALDADRLIFRALCDRHVPPIERD